jgi:thiosulfate/3-mercaptopyruvate sulfurtransferase
MAWNTLIDVRTLRALPAGSCILLDCRFDLRDTEAGRRAYLTAHIPRARYADLNRDLSSPVTGTSGRHPLPDPARFAATLSHWGIARGIPVVAYDEANGSYAARAWWLLRFMGHAEVAVLDGGFKAWVAAGGETRAGEEPMVPAAGAHAGAAADSGPRPSAARPAKHRPDAPGFEPGAALCEVVDGAAVAERMLDPGFLLVDARAAERFTGSVEPIDAVAGHIPGAVNHPFSSNLAADGRFLPAPQLRHLWERRLAGRRPADVVAMCGSGVTACHNLLALEIAGLRGAKLYAGSWSEWIRDPRRPRTTGG